MKIAKRSVNNAFYYGTRGALVYASAYAVLGFMAGYVMTNGIVHTNNEADKASNNFMVALLTAAAAFLYGAIEGFKQVGIVALFGTAIWNAPQLLKEVKVFMSEEPAPRAGL